MQIARLSIVLVIASCASASKPPPTHTDSIAAVPPTGEAAQDPSAKPADTQSSPAPVSDASAPTVDLTRERALIDESEAARKASDYTAARAKAAEAVTSLLARAAAERDAQWLALLSSSGRAAWDSQDFHTAAAAWEQVLEVRVAALPDEHRELQAVRLNLASALFVQGDLAAARVLREQVFEIQSRTLPDEHPDLQVARLGLANSLYAQGELAAARVLYESVLEVFSRTLPDEHPRLQAARANLANTLHAQGELVAARVLREKVLEIQTRTLPDEHTDLRAARGNLAQTLYMQGDLAAARVLQEKELYVRSRTLPDEHHALQAARLNLATTLFEQGDLTAARVLYEKVLEVQSRTLPDEHPDLQQARTGLANTLFAQGDLGAARALREKVLEVRSRTLPDQHPDLQLARMRLANTLRKEGDLAAAMALQEKVLEVNSRTLPDEHRDLQAARLNLTFTLVEQLARANRSPGGKGETKRAGPWKERCAQLIGALCRSQARAALAVILDSPGREAEERCASLAQHLDVTLSFAQGYGVIDPLRTLEAEALVYSEATRGAALASAEFARGAASSPNYPKLRSALREASDALAALAQNGATSDEFDRARVKRESVEREVVALAREHSGEMVCGMELDVAPLAKRLAAGEAAVAFRRYTKFALSVADEFDSTGQRAMSETSVPSLCAFVVRSAEAAATGNVTNDPVHASPLTLVDLGPIARIEESVRGWRDGLGVGSESRGVAVGVRTNSTPRATAQAFAVRERIFDPLLPALAGARHVIVALDDVLHLVPIDALPADENGVELLGDRFHIETRATLSELLGQPAKLEGDNVLIGIGGISYSAEESHSGDDSGSQPAASLATNAAGRSVATASILRGGAWSSGFNPLPATKDEIESIAKSLTEAFGTASEQRLLERSDASKVNLLKLAPKTRYLHIATHGWFAPDSIRSWRDPEPLDKQTGLGSRLSGAEQVKGMSPMLLCGLALAGANLPEDAVGRAPGLITADELSTLDLTNCELVVLSACDTNVGINRAGQGVASLQMALQMAGARSVITSLWKVPDEATKDLMLDFYRRMWVEKKPKWQALWEAKKMMRDAKDERGEPKYTTRDWAAWVLTGEPN